MTATIIDGKAMAREIQREIGERVVNFITNNGAVPTLAAVLVGDDPASQVYVRNKERDCERVGIESRLVRLPADVSADDLLEKIAELNHDEDVHGILVQLPLPKQITTERILDAVHPFKDVDAFHPENVGRLVQGRPRFLPCTPHGVVQMLHRSGVGVAGKEVVVVGRSDIVGKPLATMLAARWSPLGPDMAHATVTLCHSRSANLAEIVRRGDVVVAAVGQPRLITGEMIKPGAAVIDVGINRVDERLVGDVNFESVCEVAAFVSPVPGGVGPLTRAMLLENTLIAAELHMI